MKKVEIIKIPYRLYRKILYEFQKRRDSGKSLISFIEKSYMIFKGTGIVFFEDSGISLIMFSEKSCGNPKGTGLPIKAKKEYIL